MYIDPSSSALIAQLIISAGVGLYVMLRSTLRQVRQWVEKPTYGPSGFLVALSFANVALLRVWTELLGFNERDTFEMKAPPPTTHFVAAVIVLLSITILVWPVVRQTSKPGVAGKVSSAFFLALLVILTLFSLVMGCLTHLSSFGGCRRAARSGRARRR